MAEQQFPTISAGALIFGPGNTVFLMRSHKWRDKYQIPGGKIELGESIEDALRREVREETGLDIYDIEFLCVQESIFDDAFYLRKHMIFLDFTCKTDAVDVKLNSEAQEYVWVSLEEGLELPLDPFDPYTRHLIREYLEKNTSGSVGIGEQHINCFGPCGTSPRLPAVISPTCSALSAMNADSWVPADKLDRFGNIYRWTEQRC